MEAAGLIATPARERLLWDILAQTGPNWPELGTVPPRDSRSARTVRSRVSRRGMADTRGVQAHW